MVKIVRGAGIVSIQVWVESLNGRPFPGWAVLVDIKDDGKFLGKPDSLELIELRKDIISHLGD